jgi:SAM-dependent methyltransferase
VTAATLSAAPDDVLALYERALLRAAAGGSALLSLRNDLGGVYRVDPAHWCRPHLPGDASLLARCGGPTLDVGCGPGRLTAVLGRLGCPALGIDISAAAVRLARLRGATALRRDVFEPLPGHGRWRNVLLADGNIGIGGDPTALLRRCRTLLARDGRLQVELAPPGARSWAGEAVLSNAEATHHRKPTRDRAGDTASLRWAVVAANDLAPLAESAAMRTLTTWTEAGRWFATLTTNT